MDESHISRNIQTNNGLYLSRKQDLINFNRKHKRKPSVQEMQTKWNITKSGTHSYLKNNHLLSYVIIDITPKKINDSHPDIITNQILALKKHLGVVYHSDLVRLGIIDPMLQLLPEQSNLLINKHNYQWAHRLNNRMRLLSAYHLVYKRKPNTQEAAQLLGYTSVPVFLTTEHRDGQILKKQGYYHYTKASVPAQKLLTPKEIDYIHKVANLHTIISD